MVKVTTIETYHKIQLPSEWVEELGLQGLISLEKKAGEISVRPCSAISWDEVFADKLSFGTNSAVSNVIEVSGDDYLFYALERGLDAGPIIYSLLNGHPASTVCEKACLKSSGTRQARAAICRKLSTTTKLVSGSRAPWSV